MSNVVIDGVMDVQIKYSANECLELSKELSGKKEKIKKYKDELKIASAEIKANIKATEAEIESDIQTLKDGFRFIPAAKIKAELDRENGQVVIKHGDQVVSREPLADKHKALFGDMAVAAVKKAK
jgi:seryl-tRNA synthetase